jgi:sugar phosphate permease
MGMMGGVFLIPVFAQTFLGYDATQSGYLFMPMAFMMLLASPLGGALTGKVQPRYIIAASTFVAGVGIYLFSGLDPRSGPLDIIVPLSVMAFGMGFGMAQRTNIIASVVPQHEIGVASSILALARNIAGALGIAVFGTILQRMTESKLLTIARLSTIHSANPVVMKEAIGLMVLKAEISSYGTVFTIAAIILFIGAAFSLLIRVKKNEVSKVEVFVE